MATTSLGGTPVETSGDLPTVGAPAPAQQLGVDYHLGITASVDTFYEGQERSESANPHLLRWLQGHTDWVIGGCFTQRARARSSSASYPARSRSVAARISVIDGQAGMAVASSSRS